MPRELFTRDFTDDTDRERPRRWNSDRWLRSNSATVVETAVVDVRDDLMELLGATFNFEFPLYSSVKG
jgi:hypothetical protein